MVQANAIQSELKNVSKVMIKIIHHYFFNKKEIMCNENVCEIHASNSVELKKLNLIYLGYCMHSYV